LSSASASRNISLAMKLSPRFLSLPCRLVQQPTQLATDLD